MGLLQVWGTTCRTTRDRYKMMTIVRQFSITHKLPPKTLLDGSRITNSGDSKRKGDIKKNRKAGSKILNKTLAFKGNGI